jgi:hypothetical protein
LAESHNFSIGLTLWIEVRTTLTATHWKGGERVLEDLFETEEFEDGKIYRWVESAAALVWTDSRAVLDTITSIDAHFTFVIHPWDSEHELTFWFEELFENRDVLWILFEYNFE